jgi:nitrate/nitrite transporter NarK
MLKEINLFDFKSERIRILHFTWFAFFTTFYIWFNHAPLMGSMRAALDLNDHDQQVKVLLILNVALTIPARIIIGMLVDKFGPRILYSLLLVISGVLCILFSMVQTYEQLALMRFLLGFVGAGFVIGIRMIGEWFPHKHLGLAEGLYGGLGNFGSAAAALTLPTVANFLMSLINSEWSLFFAVVIVMFCALFVMAGAGAVFAVVPLIKRRMTGQIAGMTGAYGNVGAVIYLTILSFVPASTFFIVIAASALVVMVFVFLFFEDPKGQTAETLPDGTVQMIDVG